MIGQFPDFLGIGAQKAGTTWLHANLAKHPGVMMPKRKELHYFNREPRILMSLYKAKFRGASGRMAGEITPAYGHVPLETIREIHGHNPDLKLLLMLRNPVARAWSGAVMELATFQGLNAKDVPEAAYLKYLESDHSTDRTRYMAMLENWEQVFPKEQLFIGFFEDLKARPWELLLDVFRHLGVSDEVQPGDFVPKKRVMPVTKNHGVAKSRGTTGDMPAFAAEFLGALYKDEIEALKARFGAACANW